MGGALIIAMTGLELAVGNQLEKRLNSVDAINCDHFNAASTLFTYRNSCGS